jgi:putative membrane protein insertion efficiency factor
MRTLLLVAAALSTVAALAIGGRSLALAGIAGYRQTLAPVAEALGARCRFEPTCSRYAEAVIARDGVLGGGWKAVRRVARCHPWTPPGTRDDP